MKVKLIIKRYPFVSYLYSNDFAFRFEPKLFYTLTGTQEFEFSHFLASINDKIKEIKEAYMKIRISNAKVKFIEFENQVEIEIDEQQLQKIIEFAKNHGIKLRSYAEVLPIISEEQFERIRQYAKKYGYKDAISKFISS